MAMIPLCDLKQQYLALKPQIDATLVEVAADCQYILGRNVQKLEQDVAQLCQCRYAVGVASGTDALYLAMRCVDIGPGAEVITTPFSFAATSESIAMTGATPVFVDIDARTYNIDPDEIEAAITPRTKAILPVHLFGQPCQMEPIMDLARRHKLYVVEDCAQAIGATYGGRPVGSLGDAGCLSFFPSKNLGCFGDGGMIVTNSQEICQRAQRLRRHGASAKYYHDELGLNSRLDEIQAAILRVKLPHLSRWNALRRQHACRYNELLADVAEITRPEIIARAEPVYNQYTIQVPHRDSVLGHLSQSGIGHAIYYPVPLHLQKVHAQLGYRVGSMPIAESCSSRCLSLPMFPELADHQQREVSSMLIAAVAGEDWGRPARTAA